MRTLVVLVIALASWAAESVPPGVARALDTYDREVLKAQTAYRAAVDRAKAKAVKVIDLEKQRATKAGDLEIALAVKKEADKLADHKPGGLADLDFLGNEMKEKAEKERLYNTLVIKSAEYGAKATYVDVTEKVQAMVKDNKLKMTPRDLRIDPTPNVYKSLKITYLYKGREVKKVYPEVSEISYPEGD